MAHTFGKNSARASSASNPITTASFTIARDETVLVLMIKTRYGAARAGGAPSFGGVTMLQVSTEQHASASPECGAELFYLTRSKGLPEGAWTANIPNTGAATLFYTFATAKAAGGSQSELDQQNGANATNTNPSPGSVTTTVDGCALFAIVASGAQTWAPSGQAGTNIANTDDGVDGGGEQYLMQATRGAINLNWTFATSDDYGAVVGAFKEVQDLLLENYKTDFRSQSTGIMSITEKIH